MSLPVFIKTLLVASISVLLTHKTGAKPTYNYVSKENKEVLISKEKTKVLIFLSAVCPCSQSHFNHLNELQKKYKQFEFIGFHSNKVVTTAKAQKYFNQFEIDFPIYDDSELIFANKYKALKTPHVFFLDKNDQMLFQGGVSNSRRFKNSNQYFLKDALEAYSLGKPIKHKESKALGCYISR